jgi:hypothetical protein
LSFPFTDDPGNYRLGAVESGRDIRGFSVNLPTEASDLERLPEEELANIFGPSSFQLARDEDEIQRDVRTGRVGREFYPYLALLLVAVLALEHLLSNCFHGTPMKGPNRRPTVAATGTTPAAASRTKVSVPS